MPVLDNLLADFVEQCLFVPGTHERVIDGWEHGKGAVCLTRILVGALDADITQFERSPHLVERAG